MFILAKALQYHQTSCIKNTPENATKHIVSKIQQKISKELIENLKQYHQT